MSTCTTAFSLAMRDVVSIGADEKEELIRQALDDLKSSGITNMAFQEGVLRAIFGLDHPPPEIPFLLTDAFGWICSYFATEIPTPIEMPAIYHLRLDTSFGMNPPPFGFTERDENVSYLTYATMLHERPRLDGCDEVPLSSDDPKMLLEWRKVFLSWLDFCIQRKTDLISFEL